MKTSRTGVSRCAVPQACAGGGEGGVHRVAPDGDGEPLGGGGWLGHLDRRLVGRGEAEAVGGGLNVDEGEARVRALREERAVGVHPASSAGRRRGRAAPQQRRPPRRQRPILADTSRSRIGWASATTVIIRHSQIETRKSKRATPRRPAPSRAPSSRRRCRRPASRPPRRRRALAPAGRSHPPRRALRQSPPR